MRFFLHRFPFFTLVLLTACTAKPKGLPTATGGIDEVLVVCGDSLWRAGVRKGVKKALDKKFPMLPQEESVFSFIRVKPKGFTELLRRSRNLLLFRKANRNSFRAVQNKYAQPQLLFIVAGKAVSDINAMLLEFKDSIIHSYYQSDLDYLQSQNKNANQSDDAGLKEMGVYLEVPDDYPLHVVDTTYFQWFRKNTLKSCSNVIVYESPWDKDKQIDRGTVVKLRDSCVGQFVRGDRHSHMVTENRPGLRPSIKTVRWGERSLTEVRGLWKISEEFLGGPFLSYWYVDKAHKRIVAVEGFLLAPNEKKHNTMIQLEAILRTFHLQGEIQGESHTARVSKRG